jgi:hypothetical protein
MPTTAAVPTTTRAPTIAPDLNPVDAASSPPRNSQVSSSGTSAVVTWDAPLRKANSAPVAFYWVIWKTSQETWDEAWEEQKWSPNLDATARKYIIHGLNPGFHEFAVGVADETYSPSQPVADPTGWAEGPVISVRISSSAASTTKAPTTTTVVPWYPCENFVWTAAIAEADAAAVEMAEVTEDLQEAADDQQAALQKALAAGFTMDEIQAYLEAQSRAEENKTPAVDDNPLLQLFYAANAVQSLLATATAVVAVAQEISAEERRVAESDWTSSEPKHALLGIDRSSVVVPGNTITVRWVTCDGDGLQDNGFCPDYKLNGVDFISNEFTADGSRRGESFGSDECGERTELAVRTGGNEFEGIYRVRLKVPSGAIGNYSIIINAEDALGNYSWVTLDDQLVVSG